MYYIVLHYENKVVGVTDTYKLCKEYETPTGNGDGPTWPWAGPGRGTTRRDGVISMTNLTL